jgi:threonylcarbamoyladenosine tRNA methylthiotransferase MtaB
MRRRYLRELYEDRVNKIKQLMPNCCIGVDVIVGFPGETEQDFLDSYNFLNELDISYLHVFTYSERANTAAPEMGNPVPMKIRQKRSKMLRILSEKKKRVFYEKNLGNTATVLFEDDVEDGMIHGFTENYVRVSAKYDPMLVNELKTVQLKSINDKGFVDVKELDMVFEAH